MTILATLALVFGAVAGIANLPQAWKIFKRKSAKDISIITYGLLITGAIIWIAYGWEIQNIPVLVTNSIGGFNIGLVILGWFLYGRD